MGSRIGSGLVVLAVGRRQDHFAQSGGNFRSADLRRCPHSGFAKFRIRIFQIGQDSRQRRFRSLVAEVVDNVGFGFVVFQFAERSAQFGVERVVRIRSGESQHVVAVSPCGIFHRFHRIGDRTLL